MNNLENINNIDEYIQVCVWRNTIVGKGREEKFESFFLKETGFKIKYIKEIKSESGNHVLFFINSNDIPKFAITRLTMFNGEISWIEDYLDNIDNDDEKLSLKNFRTW